MIAQHELQRLLGLPMAEKLQIAQQLIESALRETVGSENGDLVKLEAT